MPGHIYPTVAETIEAHRLLIDEFGGTHGLRDRKLLEAAVLRPRSGYYTNVIEEAAALMESLVKNHAFLDGNKRIGFVMADVLLRANGYSLDVKSVTAHKFIMESMASGEFQFDVIRDWMAAHTMPA